jgi:hypothetical protein
VGLDDPCHGAVVVDVARYDLGGTTLTRVPYFDIALGAEVLGLRPEDVAAVADPDDPWTEGDDVLVGQALWVVDAPGTRIVIDPCGASDAFLRTGPDAVAHQDAVVAALAAAGVDLESVDAVLLSHLDGIGMVASVDAEGGWGPMFPRATVLLTHQERAHLASVAGDDEVSGLSALRALEAGGVVDGIDDDAEVAPGVTIEVTGRHSPGHALIHVVGDERSATFVGHLSLTPLNLSIATPSTNHIEVDASDAVLRRVASDAAADGRLLIGPLWPWPGACTLPDGPAHPRPATPDA